MRRTLLCTAFFLGLAATFAPASLAHADGLGLGGVTQGLADTVESVTGGQNDAGSAPIDDLGATIGQTTTQVVETLIPSTQTQPSQTEGPAETSTLAGVVEEVLPVAAPVVSEALEPLAPVTDPVIEPLAPITKPVIDTIAPVTTSVTEPLAPTIEQALEPVTPILEEVTAPVNTVTETVVEPIAPIVEEVMSPVAPVLETVVEPVAPVVEDILAVTQPVIDNVVVPVTDAVAQPLVPVIETVVDPVTSVIIPPVVVIVDEVVSPVVPVIEDVVTPVIEVIDPVIDTLPPVIDPIAEQPVVTVPVTPVVTVPALPVEQPSIPNTPVRSGTESPFAPAPVAETDGASDIENVTFHGVVPGPFDFATHVTNLAEVPGTVVMTGAASTLPGRSAAASIGERAGSAGNATAPAAPVQQLAAEQQQTAMSSASSQTQRRGFEWPDNQALLQLSLTMLAVAGFVIVLTSDSKPRSWTYELTNPPA